MVTRTLENQKCREALERLAKTVSCHGADSVEVEKLLDALIQAQGSLLTRVVVSNTFFIAMAFFFIYPVMFWILLNVPDWIIELLI